MSSDLSVKERQSQTYEMRDLQEDHRKRRSELIKRNEQDLQNLEENYREKKQQISQTSAAAVSHLKRDKEVKLKELRENGESQVLNTRVTYGKRAADETRAGDSKLQNIKEHHSNQIEASTRANKTLAKQALDEQLRIRQQAKNEEKQYQVRREKAETEAQSDIISVRNKARMASQQAKTAGQEDLTAIEGSYRERAATTKKENSQRIQQEREQAHRQIRTTQTESQKKIEGLRKKNSEVLNRDQNTYRNLAVEIKKTSEKEIGEMKREHAGQLSSEVARAKTTEKKIQTEHGQEVQRLHKTGDRSIASERLRQEQAINSQKEYFEQQASGLNQEFNQRKNNIEQGHMTELKRRDEIYDQSLQQQKAEFENQYTVNKQLQNDSLTNQQLVLTKALLRQRAELAQKLDACQQRADDPFYRLVNPASEFIDTENFYVLRAQIPEHEKDNVNIRVQKDSVAISGQREYADRIARSDHGHQIESKNYQTFREEFKLAHPVYEKGIIKSYADGMMTVKIPKLGKQKTEGT